MTGLFIFRAKLYRDSRCRTKHGPWYRSWSGRYLRSYSRSRVKFISVCKSAMDWKTS